MVGELDALLERWRLVPPSRAHGTSPGERPGARLGSGLEFHDRRAYAAGDDLRRLDWRALARSDQVLVRLAREELSPRLELLVDLSASMAIDDAKARLARDLAAFLAGLARQAGWPVLAVGLAAAPRRMALDALLSPSDDDRERELAFAPGPHVGAALPLARPLLAPGGVRVVLSDFLGGDVAPALAPLADGAAAVVLLQVLGADEATPPIGGRARLLDAETGAEVEVELDRHAVETYTARLAALGAALADHARRLGGRFVPLIADAALDALARDRLHAAGLIEPA